jgi:hypothetical protein
MQIDSIAQAEPRPCATDGASELEIPGISAAEFDMMCAAASRFCEAAGIAMASDDAGVEGMRALMDAAGPDAAGLVSASRDYYRKWNGAHWMYMPHIAAGEAGHGTGR